MIRLSFGGEYSLLAGFGMCLAAGAIVFFLYRKETQNLPRAVALTLPALRTAVMVLLILMLTGPTLKRRHTEGTLTKVLVFIDASQSMESTDPEMSIVRKLSLARALRWLPRAQNAEAAESGSEKLTLAASELKKVIRPQSVSDNALGAALEKFAADTHSAVDLAQAAGLTAKQKMEMERELSETASRLARTLSLSGSNTQPPAKECIALVEKSLRWQKTFSLKARSLVVEQVGSERKAAATLDRFAHTTRMERVRALLLDGGKESLLSELSPNFSLELFALEGAHAQLLWKSEEGKEFIPNQLPTPDGTVTDLGAAILEQIPSRAKGSANGSKEGRTAVVLLSDGRHNATSGAASIARLLGDRGIPIYCVGIGSEDRTEDLAIIGIDAPATVYFEDRISGLVSIRDDMAAGQNYRLQFSFGETMIWEKELVTSQGGLLKVPFDFPVKELVESSLKSEHGRQTVVPLSLQANVSILSQEREVRNNTANLLVRATTGKRGILLLDGRPRWEMLYIRSLFERDPQWQTNSLILRPDGGIWPRGLSLGTFPADQETLNNYDMIVYGDVPRSAISDQELHWLEEFVAKRGGGLLFLDGLRHSLSQYGAPSVGRLLPVTFQDEGAETTSSSATVLELTERGSSFAALKLDETQTNPAERWNLLPSPRRLTRCEALPGTETLVEGLVDGRRIPALVIKRYGAGHVAYLGFDETWRWRTGKCRVNSCGRYGRYSRYGRYGLRHCSSCGFVRSILSTSSSSSLSSLPRAAPHLPHPYNERLIISLT